MNDTTWNEAKRTAYVLGELDADEAARLEAELARDPELAREIEELRAVSALLEEELGGESFALDPARRATIDAELTRPAPPHRTRWPLVLLTGGGLAAAAAVSLFLLQQGTTEGTLPAGAAASLFGDSGETVARREQAPPRAGAELQQLDEVAEEPALSPVDMEELRGMGYVSGDDATDNLQALGYTGGPTSPGPLPARSYRAAGRKAFWANGGKAAVPQTRRVQIGAPGQRPGAPSEGFFLGYGEPQEEYSREGYASIQENDFLAVRDAPLSTFSIDVDTASYANVRRFLRSGQLPPADAVRIEELVNYFRYDDPAPTGEVPFAVTTEVARAPWAPEHLLLRIGLKGREMPELADQPRNLVFLLDVSGSMDSPDKLPLLKRALRLLVGELGPRDRVAMVVYAGASGLVLPSTPATEKATILDALDRLDAGGSTAGAAGIQLAYQVAREHLGDGGIHRVILATDGDFNVGVSDEGSLVRLIEKERADGISLSVLGFGTGNLQDSKMEQLADHGNGNYAYIDSVREAQKVLVHELGGTLETIAKDVKLQLEFNPAEVAGYRLIGYENRKLADADFNDDTKDAGEIGAGHSVTALYELVPAGLDVGRPAVDPLKYQEPSRPVEGAGFPRPFAGELLTVKLRYKDPDGTASKKLEVPVKSDGIEFARSSTNLRFAASVAAFGMLLRGSAHAGHATYQDVLAWAEGALGEDPYGYRGEFLDLVQRAAQLAQAR